MPDFGDVEFLQMLKERKIRLDGLVMEQYFNGLFHKKSLPVGRLRELEFREQCRCMTLVKRIWKDFAGSVSISDLY